MRTAGVAVVAAVLLLGVNYLAFVKAVVASNGGSVKISPPPVQFPSPGPESVQITLQSATHCLIDGEREPLPIKGIKDWLVRSGESSVLLKADESIALATLVEAMDQVRAAGVSRIAITHR